MYTRAVDYLARCVGLPAAVPVVDDFNYVDSASKGPKEVRSDSSLEVLDEEEELGRSTRGWD